MMQLEDNRADQDRYSAHMDRTVRVLRGIHEGRIRRLEDVAEELGVSRSMAGRFMSQIRKAYGVETTYLRGRHPMLQGRAGYAIKDWGVLDPKRILETN